VQFRPIPGYALTRTWERTPTPGSKTVAIKLNATDIEIPVFWQVGDRELGTYDCGPLVGYTVKGSIIPPKGATFGPTTIDRTTAAGTITVGDKTINICLAGKPVGFVSLQKRRHTLNSHLGRKHTKNNRGITTSLHMG
jgi:hypothetical protein